MKIKKLQSITNSKGLTLLELMITVAIIGILAGLAASTMSNDRTTLRSAARDIVSNVQKVRFRALETGRTWAVEFDTESEIPSYKIIDSGKDGKLNTTDDKIYKIVSFEDYPGISFGSSYGAAPKDYGETDISDGISAYENRFIFNDDGTTGYDDKTKKSQGVVYIKTEKGDTFAVGMVSAAGMIKTWHNDGSGWED